MSHASAENVKPVTIALDVRSVCEDRAGIGFYTQYLLNALAKLRRHETFLLLGDSRTAWDLLPANLGFVHEVIDAGSLWWHLHAFLRSRKVDLYHSPSSMIVPWLNPGKAVLTVHDLAPLRMGHLSNSKTWWSNRLLRSTVRRVQTVLTVSEYTATDLHRLVPKSRTPMEVTPLAPRPRPDLEDDAPAWPRPYFLAVGTLEPRKNLPMLINAYQDALQHCADLPELLIAGKLGWKNHEFWRALEVSSLHDRVHVLGYVSDTRLEALYRDTVAFVYPSLLEGFGLPVVEAMARGVPVITSATSSLPEVGGEAVLYVDPTDRRSIAEQILNICDPRLQQELRERGRHQAAIFTWEKTAQKTLQAYHEVLSRTSGTKSAPASH